MRPTMPRKGGKRNIVAEIISEPKEVVLVLITFGIAATVFFWKFQTVGLSHWDEYSFIGTAASMSPSVGWGHLFVYDPPLFALMLFAMFTQFGFHDYVAVATSGVIAFALCVVVFVWVNFEYGLRTAIISTLILATTELFIFYARMALSDMAFTFFFSLALFAYFKAINNRKGWTYLLAGVMLTLTIATKYNGFEPLLIAAIFTPIFHAISLAARAKSVKRNITDWGRSVLQSFSGLWISAAPAELFIVLYLAFLGQPFHISDIHAMLAITHDLIPRVGAGLAYFIRVIYPTKLGAFAVKPFETAHFYLNVLTHFIATPILALALIGAVTGVAKRNQADILLTVWVAFIFISFASQATTYARVILPAVVPIAILAGSGLMRLLAALDRFLRHQRRLPMKGRIRPMTLTFLVLAIVAVNVVWAIPAIANTHSAYRLTANFIAQNVPDGQLVWIGAQPILFTYMGLLGKNVIATDNASALGEAYVVVLDFTAQFQPDWPQVEARISKMQLVFSIKNDVPVVNVLDWTKFSHLNSILSNETMMRIRIFANPGQIQSQIEDAPTSAPSPEAPLVTPTNPPEIRFDQG